MDKIPAWMDELFDELNREHFDGGLQRPKFAVNKLGHYAFYAPHVQIIFMHPRTLDQERKFVADVDSWSRSDGTPEPIDDTGPRSRARPRRPGA